MLLVYACKYVNMVEERSQVIKQLLKICLLSVNLSLSSDLDKDTEDEFTTFEGLMKWEE